MAWFVMVIFSELIFIAGKTTGELLADYTKRLCNNEPTCSFVNHPSIPTAFRTLEKRNCLCDHDCKEYKDCCIDSMFYKIHDQLPPFSYHCSANKKVYMKTRCLPEWTDATMVAKCQKSILPLEDDLSVITPLTNLVTGVTYGNVYCAVCNNAFTAENARDFYTWTLSTRCGRLADSFALTRKVEPQSIPNLGPTPLLVQLPRFVPLGANFETTLKQLDPTFGHADHPPKTGYYLLVLLLYHVHPPSSAAARMARQIQLPIAVESAAQSGASLVGWASRHKRNASSGAAAADVDFDAYADEWDAIALHAAYDADAKLWISRYKMADFVCEYEAKVPQAGGDVPLRACIPNVIAECSRFEDAVPVHECRLSMAVVYDKRGYAFRNKGCALCNGVRPEDLFFCPYDEGKISNYVDDADADADDDVAS